jgi:exosortase A
MKRDLPLQWFPSNRTATATGRVWRAPLAALAVSLGWIGAWYASTASVMIGTWANSETFAHGFIVLPIVCWLIWRIRDRVALLHPEPDWRMLPLLVLAGGAWLAGKLGAVNVVAQFALVASLVLTVPAVLGIAVARALLFPLGFLFFCVPVGEFLLPTLMDHTANFTVAALRASGVAVYREGLQFVVPTGRWSVVEACSGVRYLIASLMVGTLFAYLNYNSAWRRWAFVGAAIAVPVVANWLRAYMIVMLGHLTNNRLAVGVDHVIYGWVFFGIVMLLMFWLGSRWREDNPDGPLANLMTGEMPVRPAAPPARFWRAAAATMALVVVWPLAGLRADAALSAAPVHLSIDGVPGWNPEPDAGPVFEPLFSMPSATVHHRFARGQAKVGLFVAYYRDKGFARKLVSSENRLLSSQDTVWNSVRSSAIDVDIDGRPRAVPVTELQTRDGHRLVAAQWYWIDGTVTSSDAIAKAATAWSRLLGRGDDSAAIIVYSRAATLTDATAELQAFVRDASPQVSAALADARARR